MGTDESCGELDYGEFFLPFREDELDWNADMRDRSEIALTT
jgi:hypothetical protein